MAYWLSCGSQVEKKIVLWAQLYDLKSYNKEAAKQSNSRNKKLHIIVVPYNNIMKVRYNHDMSPSLHQVNTLYQYYTRNIHTKSQVNKTFFD